MLEIMSAVGVVVLAVLVFLFIKNRRSDQLVKLMDKRRATARVVSKADFASGRDRLPVALSLTDEHIYYENPDLEADVELARVEEVEYDDELTTGHGVEEGERVLRLRSHGAAFEFVMSGAEAAKWQQALPTTRGASSVSSSAQVN